jgi:hypothetical protein
MVFWNILAFVARFNSSEVYLYAVLEDYLFLGYSRNGGILL